jgi:hypothetical protein
MTRVLFLSLPTCDYYAHLWNISLYERGMGFGRMEVAHGLFSGTVGNPPIPFALYSKLPRAWRIPIGVGVNFLFDSIAALLVFFFLRAGLSVPGSEEQLPFSAACLGALLYTTTPLLHPLSARLLGLGSRTLGNLIVTAYFIILGYWLRGDGQGILLLTILFLLAALIILSSKFALQVLVFLSLTLSLVSWDPRPCYIAGGSLLVMALVPGFDVRTYLKTRYNHARWYLKAIGHPTMSLQLTTVYRGSWKVLRSLPRLIRRKPDFGIWILLAHVPLFIVLYSVPILSWLGVRIIAGGAGTAADNLFQGYAGHLCVAALLLVLATSIRPLIIFGEAERYMEAVLPFLYLMAVEVALTAFPGTLILLLLANLFVILFLFAYANRAIIAAKFSIRNDGDFMDLLAFLRTLEGRRSVVTTPHKLALMIDANLESDFHYYFHLHSRQNGLDNIFRYFYNYFMFNLDFATLHRELGADTFILDRSYRHNYREAGLLDRLDQATKLYENKNYEVFSFPE